MLLNEEAAMSGSVSTAATDAAAFFEAYQPRIYRYVSSLMHDPAEAEDVTMDTFLRAHSQRDEHLPRPAAPAHSESAADL